MKLVDMSSKCEVLFGKSVGFIVRSVKTGNEFRVVSKHRGGKFMVEGVNIEKDSLLDGTIAGRYEPVGKLATALTISSKIDQLNSELDVISEGWVE